MKRVFIFNLYIILLTWAPCPCSIWPFIGKQRLQSLETTFLSMQVIPQLIARIDTPRALVGRLIHQLLTDIGRYHPQVSLLTITATCVPKHKKQTGASLLWKLGAALSVMHLISYLQALIYPLTVASKSTTTARHNAANKILKNMCEHCNTLVQQAIMVNTLMFVVSG